MPSTLEADDVSGAIVGVMLFGIDLFRFDSFSDIDCLFLKISVPSSNITVTTDSPGMDCDLIWLIPIVPAIACSIGLVTRDSTKSDENPGDSV